MKDTEPVHGYCSLCKGPIVGGVRWTMTGLMLRVHADPDDCVSVLDPELYRDFLAENPNYKSKARYGDKNGR